MICDRDKISYATRGTDRGEASVILATLSQTLLAEMRVNVNSCERCQSRCMVQFGNDREKFVLKSWWANSPQRAVGLGTLIKLPFRLTTGSRSDGTMVLDMGRTFSMSLNM